MLSSEIIGPEEMSQILGGACYGMACRKIREVKFVSDRLGIRGRIHIDDWKDYLNRFNKKDGAPAIETNGALSD